MKPTTSRGFTLIELMIVVAIIAVLAAIAIPAYQNYLRETRMTKVISHYENAIRLVRGEVAKNASVQARGQPAILPPDSAGWIELLDPDHAATAPQGGFPAYAVTPENDVGVVGVQYDDTRRVVIITRPAYLDLSLETVVRETIDIH